MQWKGLLLLPLSSIEAYNVYIATIGNMGERHRDRKTQRQEERQAEADMQRQTYIDRDRERDR